ncbi:chromosome transmission fidelity protein 18 homolog [Protopterus annectens]|uniref:chromosome transmission fidelity protein 18 homolog n=1 Tax=Protopterus annectens TaxID=7888 RepID=UPI001CFB97B0|nr:chromosome transmission fidelity protein 18 homolog [Protopterus annectens]
MDEYDEMYGIEDDYEEHFADELEVLAELEPAEPIKVPKVSQFRNKQTFEDAIIAGDREIDSTAKKTDSTAKKSKFHQKICCQEQDIANDTESNTKKREWSSIVETVESDTTIDLQPPLTPKPKRPRLEAVKKLNFSQIFEDYPVPLPDDITPTPDPENYSGNQNCLPETKIGWNGQRHLHLLGVPFSFVKEQVAEERRRKILEESERLTEMLNSQIDREFGIVVRDPVEEEEDDTDDENEEKKTVSLWVDKFTPRHYTELLSDDYTNRCLLKWLKLWDVVVFGREKNVKKNKVKQETRPSFKQQKEQQNKWKSKEQITEEILDAELDQHNRPKHKVALLCGPPGLGKTTLAHVIAKHAGYNVVEMNASDDRSPDAFKTKIETATQMKSVLGVNEKPNCLVIDEIDGAPTAAINVLLSIINRKDGKEGETSGGPGGGGGKKKKKEGGLLMRPVICICNDQYVPALRQLRQQAFLLNFPQTLPSRLVQRLYEISRKQGMKADTGTLTALCEKTENDIRSCINTLQFLHGRGKKALNIRMVQTMKIGLKDQNKGLFSVWQEIFQLPRQQRKRIGQDPSIPIQILPGGDDDPLNLQSRTPISVQTQRFHHILHIAMSTGEHEKVTQGLFDNFLNMKLKDPNFSHVCLALDWLEFTDILNEVIMHGQNFQLMRYLPFLPVTFHMVFAASSVSRIAYPNSHYEAQTKSNQMNNLVTSMLSEISPTIRTRIGPQSLILEILCLLLDIISPKLRPVNTQLYSPKEKQQLADLIGTMLAYNLTYHQERTPDGQYVYMLDPNMEEVCRFPDLPVKKPVSYQTKQLIAREIELEKMRRAEALLQARNANVHIGDSEETTNKTPLKVADNKAAASVKNHEQRLENIVRKATFADKPELDFFGRQVVKKEKRLICQSTANTEIEKDTAEKRIGKAIGNSDVWFRFNEGVSNAVRRNIYIKDLL